MKPLLKYVFVLCAMCLCLLNSNAQDSNYATDEYAVDSTEVYSADSENEYEPETDTFIAANRTLNDDDWAELENDSVFKYKDERESEFEEKKIAPQKETWFEKAVTRFFNFLASDEGQVIFWLIIISVLGYVFYRIFKGDMSFIFNRKEKTITTENNSILTQEDLTSADWEAHLQKALAEGNTRLATRFTFVSVLQLLHKNQHINYRIDTTNFEYYNSLKQDELKPLFRQILLRYEYAWFGQFAVSEKDWKETMNLYQQIKSKV